MEEVTRKRILRLLEGLPEAQLYQVLDFMEFLAAKYAAEASRKPDAFQRFAERVEDQMRVRALAPKAMKGTLKIMSTAGKMIDGVRDLGKDLVKPPARTADSPATPGAGRPAASSPAELAGTGDAADSGRPAVPGAEGANGRGGEGEA